MLQLLKAYDADKGDKVVIVKRFDEGKSVLDVTATTTEVKMPRLVHPQVPNKTIGRDNPVVVVLPFVLIISV